MSLFPLCQLVPPKPQVHQPLAQAGVFSIEQSFLDQLQQARDAGFRFLVVLPEPMDALADAIFTLKGGPNAGIQHRLEALRIEHATRHLAKDDVVEPKLYQAFELVRFG